MLGVLLVSFIPLGKYRRTKVMKNSGSVVLHVFVEGEKPGIFFEVGRRQHHQNSNIAHDP